MSDLFNPALVTGTEEHQSRSVTEGKTDGIAMANATAEFSWRSNEDIVCRRQPATACYRNVNEMVVIRQEADWNEEQDTIVILADETVPKLIRALAAQIGVESDVNDALLKNEM